MLMPPRSWLAAIALGLSAATFTAIQKTQPEIKLGFCERASSEMNLQVAPDLVRKRRDSQPKIAPYRWINLSIKLPAPSYFEPIDGSSEPSSKRILYGQNSRNLERWPKPVR